ncbi:TetR/AcrR family transcriptional regulator [Streptosporangium sp. NPDC003464]
MPRVADHDQRRAQIARAFQRLLAAEGFAAASFSRMATEAGVSVGLIQHYFAGKDVLLHFAYEDAVSRMGERVRVRVRDGEAARLPIAEVLFDSLAELLPLDEERDLEYRVRQGLQAQALHHAGLADVARRAGGDLLGYVTSVVENGMERGEVEPGADAVLAARMILATVQGLADQVALSGADAFSARDVLRRAVARPAPRVGHPRPEPVPHTGQGAHAMTRHVTVRLSGGAIRGRRLDGHLSFRGSPMPRPRSESGDGGHPCRSRRGPGSGTRPCQGTPRRSRPSRSRTSPPSTRTA